LWEGEFRNGFEARDVIEVVFVVETSPRWLSVQATNFVDTAEGEEFPAYNLWRGRRRANGCGSGVVGPELEGAGSYSLVAFWDGLANAHADAEEVRLDGWRECGLADRFGERLGWGGTRVEEGCDLALGWVGGSAGEGAFDAGSRHFALERRKMESAMGDWGSHGGGKLERTRGVVSEVCHLRMLEMGLPSIVLIRRKCLSQSNTRRDVDNEMKKRSGSERWRTARGREDCNAMALTGQWRRVWWDCKTNWPDWDKGRKLGEAGGGGRPVSLKMTSDKGT
jgi:hypothetical protein